MSDTQTKPKQTNQNGTKPKPTELDTTRFSLSPATHEALLLDYANGRSTTPQQIVNVTVKKGGGVEIETVDEETK
jgi:hypothetical protein